MTKIITTNINLEDEIRTIKALEAKLEELKELKEEKEAEIKSYWIMQGLKNYKLVRLQSDLPMLSETTSTHQLSKRSILNYTTPSSSKLITGNSQSHRGFAPSPFGD